ncbi:major vault protein-like, partial [Littorina saxatilis]
KKKEKKKKQDVVRKPGERWMIRGPVEYVPPVFVEVVTTRRVISLDVSEGIYVRNVKTGKVRAITGKSYMLNQDEQLWQKELRPLVEALVNSTLDPLTHRNSRLQDHKDASRTSRDKTRVVTFRAPHNSAVQVFDFRTKKSRVVFGPELVMLNPDEDFTQLSMSGGRPKEPNHLKSLCILLGQDYCTDKIVVETSDHARLSLLLAYNWHFDVDKNNPEHAACIFSVPDLTGDMCNAMASRVRGAVAQITFDYFHKNLARIIRSSVFGVGEGGKIGKEFRFPQNRLVITDIDMKSVEPVDQRTRDALMKSVQMAIEITTNSQEAGAKHEAQRLDQEARGRLERQQLLDEAVSEEARRGLVQLQALSATVESCDQAQSEAQSRAEAARIEAEAAVEQARLKAQAMTIDSVCELETLTKSRTAELKFTAEKDRLEIDKARDTADLESAKFKAMVQTIGTHTLTSIANAGPQMQIKMLQGLGLESTLITDGASPINLFNTASGLVGGLLPPKRQFHDLDI